MWALSERDLYFKRQRDCRRRSYNDRNPHICQQVGVLEDRLEAGLPLEDNLADDGLHTTGWHIPRPSLTQSSISSPNSTAYADDNCLCHPKTGRHSTSSQGSSASSSSSTSGASTQSGSSGALLLTAANLAALRLETLTPSQLHGDKTDALSVASSTHFTVVNGVTRQAKIGTRSCCQTHQLTALVLTMSCLIFLGIVAAVLYMEMRLRSQDIL